MRWIRRRGEVGEAGVFTEAKAQARAKRRIWAIQYSKHDPDAVDHDGRACGGAEGATREYKATTPMVAARR